MSTHAIDTPMLSLEEVATQLQVGPRVIRRLVATRKLKCKRVGTKLLRFKREWIDDYVNGRYGQ